jgi:putative peptide zinc metalloprotease protein
MNPQWPPAQTPYLRWSGTAEQAAPLSPDDAAALFDGQHDAAARRSALSALWSRAVAAAELTALTHRWVACGALAAGRHEPLPVPPTSKARPAALDPALEGLIMPSSIPGSLISPAYVGSLQRHYVGGGRRQLYALPAAPFILLGRAFCWPLQHRGGAWLLLAWLALMLGALWGERFALVDGLAAHLEAAAYWRSVPLTLLAVHLVSQSSTAALYRHLTHAWPRVGLWSRWLPGLAVDTAGRAEQLPRGDRLRITGAGLAGTLSLLTAVLTVWVMARSPNPALADALSLPLLLISASLLLRANPLARYDGQALLGQWLGAPDLRLQSLFSVFNARRPWMHQQRLLPMWGLRLWFMATMTFVMFAALLLAYFALPFLTGVMGGLGFLLVISGLGVVMYKQLGRPAMPRDALGWKSRWQQLRGWRPTRKQWIVIALVIGACLFPYRYEPSGDFEVLPVARADVRALVAGDVREVLAEEGETVTAGQAVVRLADAEGRAKVAASNATLAQLRADLALLEKGARPEEIDVAESRVSTLQRRASFSRATEQRLAKAFRQGGVSTDDYEKARGTAEVDEQLLEEAKQSLALISSPAQAEMLQATQAKIEREEAALALHTEQLEQTTVRAPIAGRLVSASLQFAVGRFLERGEVIAVVEDAESRLAEALISETAVGALETGVGARLRAWAYPNSGFSGTVTHIAPTAESSRYGRFVRVQVAIDDPEGRLKSGMTGAAKLAGPRYPAIWVFTRALWRFFMVEVWSWLP